MSITLSQAIEQASANQILVSQPLTTAQFQILSILNQFAIHQARYNPEVQRFPAKMIYKVNDELKMALVALLTTCSLLDPTRNGEEAQKFFEEQVKITQDLNGNKTIQFGKIRPDLVEHALIPEVVDDWILYRDVNGDGIHALMDRKTHLQGLATYARGGHPVYEFARFYRRFMEDKIAKSQRAKEKAKEIALKSLTDQVIQRQLNNGYSPQQLLENLMQEGTDALFIESEPALKRLPKK
ncbi:MAG: hypothetical protein II942_04665 [Alphaproteobacteria bacterium]|nr:hypothetical protein [Alphaproteobacteria bacterium]